MPALKLSCQTELYVPLEEIIPIQGELKIMTAENYEKLKRSITENGFNFPMLVWQEKRTIEARVMGGNPTESVSIWAIDGHGRLRVLKQMQSEGWDIPPLPCVAIEAKSLADAKRKVLLASSQFHTMTDEGLYAFLSSDGLDMGILEDIAFSAIDVEDFKDNFLNDVAPEEEKPAKTASACPQCGYVKTVALEA